MKLHELKPARQAPKRVGRGPGGGGGKTAGRGTKGQKSRTGHHTGPVWFEGGQMSLTQRIPKLRGFRGPSAERWATVTVGQLEKSKDASVSLDSLKKAGAVPRQARFLKVIGNGKLSKKVTVTADRASAGAQKVISAAGGSVKLPAAPKKEAKPDGEPAA